MDLQYYAPGIFPADVRWRARPSPRLFEPDRPRVVAIRTGAFSAPEITSSAIETAPSPPSTVRPRPTPRRRRPRVRRPLARSSFQGVVGIAAPGDPILLVVKFRRDGPWSHGVVEG